MSQQFIDAIKHARKHQLNQQHAIKNLSTEIIKMHEALPEHTIDNITTGIKDMLKLELEYSQESTVTFKNPHMSFGWPLKTNKMPDFVIPKSLESFNEADGKVGKLITAGLGDYNLAIEGTLPILSQEGSSERFWGTSKPTFLAADLTFAYLFLEDITHPEKSSSISSFSLQSPIHHIVDCNISELPPQSKLLYDVDGKKGYGFIHGGYSFGGGRESENKLYAPQDCSSFLKHYTIDKGIPNWKGIGYSTIDLAYAYNVNDPTSSIQIPEPWFTGADGILPSQFQIVKNIHGVQNGDIWVIRTKCNAEKPFGTAGHTGFVSNMERGEKIEILAVSRDMPHMEGFGRQFVSSTSNDNQDGTKNIVMYLRPICNDILHEAYSTESIIKDTDHYMQEHLEEYVPVLGSNE